MRTAGGTVIACSVCGRQAPTDPTHRGRVPLEVEASLVAAEASWRRAEPRADRAIERGVPDAIPQAEEIVAGLARPLRECLRRAVVDVFVRFDHRRLLGPV